MKALQPVPLDLLIGQMHHAAGTPWPSVPSQKLHHPQVGRANQEGGVLWMFEGCKGVGQGQRWYPTVSHTK